MRTLIKEASIKNIDFMNEYLMIIHLDNDRTFIVPLDRFPEIKSLSGRQREDDEVIDGTHLSFVDIDEVYSIKDLTGI